MATLVRVTVLAVATAAAALFVAQPAQAATAAVQPHQIIVDHAPAKLVEDVGRRRGYYRGGGYRRGGYGYRRGFYGHRGYGYRRGYYRRAYRPYRRFYGGGYPAYGYGYPCGYGYGYGYGCPTYGYGYGAPVVTFGFGGWGGGW